MGGVMHRDTPAAKPQEGELTIGATLFAAVMAASGPGGAIAARAGRRGGVLLLSQGLGFRTLAHDASGRMCPRCAASDVYMPREPAALRAAGAYRASTVRVDLDVGRYVVSGGRPMQRIPWDRGAGDTGTRPSWDLTALTLSVGSLDRERAIHFSAAMAAALIARELAASVFITDMRTGKALIRYQRADGTAWPVLSVSEAVIPGHYGVPAWVREELQS